jgi:uncharacterized protein (DUF302 family)
MQSAAAQKTATMLRSACERRDGIERPSFVVRSNDTNVAERRQFNLSRGVGIRETNMQPKLRSAVAKRGGIPMSVTDSAGFASKPSSHSVDETVTRLRTVLEEKGITVFAVVDHSGEAEKAGMKMRPTKLVIFGNPKGGTPVMLAAPSIAIDLPLKILVWEDAEGKIWCSYNEPEYLQQRHHVPPELVPNISVAATFAAKAGE